jgi:REP element-mobilizing transposase RayT
VARSLIYRENGDFAMFVRLLATVVRRFRWKQHAFCLMPNHYHLVVESSQGDLSNGMHRLNGLYAQGFNDRYERVGHLFQNRFGARLIEGDHHLATVCAYVLDNPVRAGLSPTAEDWPWSSAGSAGSGWEVAAGRSTRWTSAVADTSAQTPSRSRKPHCSSYQARNANAVAPTRFRPMYQYDRWLSRPNCASA